MSEHVRPGDLVQERTDTSNTKFGVQIWTSPMNSRFLGQMDGDGLALVVAQQSQWVLLLTSNDLLGWAPDWTVKRVKS